MAWGPCIYIVFPTLWLLRGWGGCPLATPAMVMRDLLDVMFEDDEFADLFPKDGRPGLSPVQLALVSVLQFAENLSDRAAANAVRTRIDGKYALGLELDDSGFDHSVLCEFRARLAEADAADRLLQVMLHRLTEAGLLTSGGRQRTDATHVLAAVRTLSRSWSARACGPPWKSSPRRTRTGCCRWWSRSGTSATGARWRSARSPTGRPRSPPWPRPSAATGRRSWPPRGRPTPRPGSER
ncbi:transposase [Streptomyces sp. NPDC001588]